MEQVDFFSSVLSNNQERKQIFKAVNKEKDECNQMADLLYANKKFKKNDSEFKKEWYRKRLFERIYYKKYGDPFVRILSKIIDKRLSGLLEINSASAYKFDRR